MRFLYAALSAAAFLLADVAQIHAQCVGTIRSAGATACQQVSVTPLNIITGGNKLPVPQFDDSAVPTAIVDGVHIVALNVQYNPTGSYQTSLSASNFFVEATVQFSTLTSLADGTVVEGAEWAQLPGTFGREANTDVSGAGGLVQRTFRRRDVTYLAATLNAADGVQVFTPADGATVTNSYSSFASGSGELSMDTPSDPDYRGAGTWDLQFAIDALASSSFEGAGLSTSLTQVIVVVGAIVQYDYHLPTIQGDPQFVGFHGQSFQVHGVPDESFALISAPAYYVNSKFVYLSTGSCFYNDTACFTHPGTYMSEIYVGMAGASIHVVSGAHKDGLRSASLNGHHLSVGRRVALPAGNSSFVQRRSDSSVLVQLDAFSFNIVNSDQFVNIEMNFVDAAVLRAGAKRHVIRETEPDAVSVLLSTHYPAIPLHGLIGQTWRNVEYPGKQYIEGDVSDYQLDSIKSHRFMFSKYHAHGAE